MLDFTGWRRSRKPASPSDESPRIVIDRPIGQFPDDLDQFKWMDGLEDPDRWEETLRSAHTEAKHDGELAELLRTHYLDDDCAGSFERYRQTGTPLAIDGLLQRLGVGRDGSIADVGCGRAHAAHALFKLGYRDVTAMDPNDHWYTGTGFLKSLSDHQIKIINELSRWREVRGKFDAVISSGTVHHWNHIPQIAIETRRTMKPGGYWLMIAEFFANTARELVDLLNTHPTSTRYGSYEWAYPASAYADLIQTSGFALTGVIPLSYRGGLFYSGVTIPNDPELDRWVEENLTTPYGTVEAFWSEVDSWRRGLGVSRSFTVPQVMIFRRVGL